MTKETKIRPKSHKSSQRKKKQEKALLSAILSSISYFFSFFLHSVTPAAPNLRAHHCRCVKGSEEKEKKLEGILVTNTYALLNAGRSWMLPSYKRIHILIYQNSLWQTKIHFDMDMSIVLCYFILCGKYLSFTFFLAVTFTSNFYTFSLFLLLAFHFFCAYQHLDVKFIASLVPIYCNARSNFK